MTRHIDPIQQTNFERVELPLARAFTISRGTTTSVTNHLVTVRDEAGRVGIGGAAPAEYYGETPDSVEAILPDLLDAVEAIADPFAQQRLERVLEDVAPGQAAARAAVSVAIHDLTARQREEPLYRQWGLDPDATPPTSHTVGIADPSDMADQALALEAAGFEVLKVKLGTEDDHARLEAIRKAVPRARIRVDVNGDWDVDTALENLEWLEAFDVEFVEQPVPAGNEEGLGKVTRASDVPVAADESCITASDVGSVADSVDIVVVKLMKCGGIRPALRQIETAHAHGLDVMLGCMVESNASIAATCHLAPLVEYVDLDGSLLLAEDPCSGVDLAGGSIDLPAVDTGSGCSREKTESG